MENIKKVKGIIEALLIISEGGLTREDLKRAIADADDRDIEEGVRLLKEEYSGSARSFNIAEIAGKYYIASKPEYMPWINNLYRKAIDRLTGPSLETLAIIAYQQTVTRAEIESIRGVNVGGVIKALLDKNLIQVKGRKDVIGRPLVYGTTEKFLEIFGLNSLEDLPALKDFREEDLEYGKPAAEMMVKIDNSLPEGTAASSADEAQPSSREQSV
ncbi:MAG: SMC-Scp complex subunit ScpB [Candidatus Omnitrophota bacterium]